MFAVLKPSCLAWTNMSGIKIHHFQYTAHLSPELLLSMHEVTYVLATHVDLAHPATEIFNGTTENWMSSCG